MATKKTSQELKEQARKMFQQAKVAKLEEEAAVGRQLIEIAKNANKTVEELLRHCGLDPQSSIKSIEVKP